ncbi:MAG: hypothetical protein JO197_02990 [Acidobacteria bacterium]|nr:hypothetical protein [Acidobacteriota bacterium]MBV9476652.1 hypothetical protein [Acidobacteriota bacterium]
MKIRIAFSVVIVLCGFGAFAQERGGMLSKPAQAPRQIPGAKSFAHPAASECRAPITYVQDVGFEGIKTTAANWNAPAGGGEGGLFDKTPILTTRVKLGAGTCLDAHFSALVGSRQTYGVSSITMFQVTLTAAGTAAHRHMFGHYETPFGRPAPAVAIEAEKDVDEIGANFFQRVGTGPGDVPPGTYDVNVWWAGGPTTNGGAIGAAFVLKLYLR